jgi:hypothetical protein
MFSKLKMHKDTPIVENSAIQCISLSSKDSVAIAVGREYVVNIKLLYLVSQNIFVHDQSYLYGFYGESVENVEHGVLSTNITKLLTSGQNVPKLFPTESASDSSSFCRISILGRSLRNVTVCYLQ